MNRKLLAMAIPALLVIGSANSSIEIWRILKEYKPRYYAFAGYPLTNER